MVLKTLRHTDVNLRSNGSSSRHPLFVVLLPIKNDKLILVQPEYRSPIITDSRELVHVTFHGHSIPRTKLSHG